MPERKEPSTGAPKALDEALGQDLAEALFGADKPAPAAASPAAAAPPPAPGPDADPAAAEAALQEVAKGVPTLMNRFCRRVFRTRGGRMGSGMGTLLEGLWLFAVNRALAKREGRHWELAWLPDHDYNDFALLSRGKAWDRAARTGEVLRVEAKAMVLGADESKAHFDQPSHLIGEHDQILLLLWRWVQDGDLVFPEVVDWFLGNAREVAALRDDLHTARGGSFVDREKCPDACDPKVCVHHGEPLNADGKRERVSGPETRRVSPKTSFAANFGGMIRMLKSAGGEARAALRKRCSGSATAMRYVNFVWRHLPDEEANHFSVAEWRACAAKFKIKAEGSKADVIAAVRGGTKDYLSQLFG